MIGRFLDSIFELHILCIAELNRRFYSLANQIGFLWL
jgi:hypothetical protein